MFINMTGKKNRRGFFYALAKIKKYIYDVTVPATDNNLPK